MSVAIVHERFTEFGGSESVVEQLHQIWPDAPIYTALLDRSVLPAGLRDADIRPSRLQRHYRQGSHYARLLPWIPGAFAALDLRGFDLIVTSHHAFANRVRPPPDIPVVSYTHTPARWMWDAGKRRGEPGGVAGRLALGTFAATQRGADRRAAQRLQGIIANSNAVAARIDRWWHRAATVIAPPVHTERFTPADRSREDFFLWVGRLVPYKDPLVAVEAARRAGVRLVIAGEGRMRGAVERAAGRDVEILGSVDDATIVDLYRRCRALVFPGDEDFGIVPVEAMACGAPVIALGAGGALDTVVDGVTGILYPPGDGATALTAALSSFDGSRYDPARIRHHAESFAPDRFRTAVAAACERVLTQS